MAQHKKEDHIDDPQVRDEMKRLPQPVKRLFEIAARNEREEESQSNEAEHRKL